MLTKETVAAVSIGSAVGALQAVGFRELDNYLAGQFLTAKQSGGSPTPPLLMKQLGNFGGFSVLVNGLVSTAETGIGLYGAFSRKSVYFNRHPNVAVGLLGAGFSGLVGAFGSMAFPPVQWSNAVAVDPSRPLRGNLQSPVRINGQSQAARLGAAAIS